MEKKEREKEAQHDVVEEVKEDEWKVGRKRKAGKEKVGLGIKLRKTSTGGPRQESEEAEKATQKKAESTTDAKNGNTKADGPASESKEMNDESICAGNIREDVTRDVEAAAKSSSALVSYGSDEDDEW